MKKRVLDASAVLALLLSEHGASNVAPILDAAVMSAVNAAEVLAILARRGMSREDSLALFRRLGIEIVGFDMDHAMLSAALLLPEVARTRQISLGDRACLATAAALGLPAVTADRNWKIPQLGVKVEFIR